MLAHDPGGQRAAVVGELQVAVALDGEQPVALHAGDRLAHRGAGLAEPLGDPGAQRGDALLLELEDRAEVHLRGVDEVVHAGAAPSSGWRAAWESPILAPGTDSTRASGRCASSVGRVPAVLWFRRDLRLHDNPALLDACSRGRTAVLPLFVVDPVLWDAVGAGPSGVPGPLPASLDESLAGRLLVVHGDPAVRSCPSGPDVGRRFRARRRRLRPVRSPRGTPPSSRRSAAGVELVRTGSPYAVSPGRVRTQGRVRPSRCTRRSTGPGWRTAGAPRPLTRRADEAWLDPAAASGTGSPAEPELSGVDPARRSGSRRPCGGGRPSGPPPSPTTPPPGTAPTWPGRPPCRPRLRWGEIHPRTLLADLGDDRGAQTFRKELAWREFYADVLWHEPRAVSEYLRPEHRRARPRPAVRPPRAASRRGPKAVPASRSWTRACASCGPRAGCTTGCGWSWRPSSSRTCTWTGGAAPGSSCTGCGTVTWPSNQPDWQWVAGSGTDAAPYFRVFNPVLQGLRFDPEGDVRPSLRPRAARRRRRRRPRAVEPAAGRRRPAIPERIVDHARERQVSLDSFTALRRPH